jgi:hypothetical protein
MNAARKPQLTRDQAERVARARQVLTDSKASADRDPMSISYRLGALEWHAGELLALIAELTGGTAGMPAVNAGDEPEGDDQ